MRRPLIVFCLAFFLSIFASHPLSAQPGRGPGYGFSWDSNLTSDQIAGIQDLRLMFQEETLPLRTQLQASVLELRNSYLQGNNLEQMNAVRSRISQLQRELEAVYLEYQDEVKGLLTDDQRALFDRWAAAGPELGIWGGGGYGFRGGRGRGPGAGWAAGAGAGLGPASGTGLGWGAGMGRGWRCPGGWFPR